ncbi:MAG: methyltransferase domain-containing protein, partial [Planctomycetota bacterium]
METYWTDAGADLYDIAFDWQREGEADFAERCVDAYGGSTGAVLDLACGGGRFLQEMAGRRWRVAGVDLSRSMTA